MKKRLRTAGLSLGIAVAVSGLLAPMGAQAATIIILPPQPPSSCSCPPKFHCPDVYNC